MIRNTPPTIIEKMLYEMIALQIRCEKESSDLHIITNTVVIPNTTTPTLTAIVPLVGNGPILPVSNKITIPVEILFEMKNRR